LALHAAGTDSPQSHGDRITAVAIVGGRFVAAGTARGRIVVAALSVDAGSGTLRLVEAAHLSPRPDVGIVGLTATDTARVASSNDDAAGGDDALVAASSAVCVHYTDGAVAVLDACRAVDYCTGVTGDEGELCTVLALAGSRLPTARRNHAAAALSPYRGVGCAGACVSKADLRCAPHHTSGAVAVTGADVFAIADITGTVRIFSA
jgi:hypothetical protein